MKFMLIEIVSVLAQIYTNRKWVIKRNTNRKNGKGTTFSAMNL
jgi:hypothetical protein